MSSFLKSILLYPLFPFVRRYHDLTRRVHDLEVALDAHIVRPEWIDDKSVYFNGQIERQRIFCELLQRFRFSVAIELGTFIGNTTGFLAKSIPHGRILSCEVSSLFYSIAEKRLGHFCNILLSCDDSRKFLEKVDVGDTDTVFIYLDAHWNSDLPLQSELEICSQRFPDAIIMIDDFEVLGDSGYQYDNYGRKRSLSFGDFGSAFRRLGYSVYLPSTPSSHETGARRGCVVLARQGPLSDELGRITTLKMAT